MKWFTETFIKSLDEKMTAKGKSFVWITEKQMNICLKYMTPQSVNDGYYAVVGDSQYTLQVFNGYGKVTRCDRRIGIR